MYQGKPCWFELSTNPGKLAEVEAFYRAVIART